MGRGDIVSMIHGALEMRRTLVSDVMVHIDDTSMLSCDDILDHDKVTHANTHKNTKTQQNKTIIVSEA